MTVYNLSGMPVEIVAGDLENGDVRIKYFDGYEIDTNMIYLRADGGINEICKEVVRAGGKVSRLAELIGEKEMASRFLEPHIGKNATPRKEKKLNEKGN